jgi:cell division protein ZapA (FtsZ GTPase activity inhibitor)
MKKTISVKIGGQEYKLRSDDEAKVREVASAVDAQFRQLQSSSKEPSTATLSILTALNIAEQEYDARQQEFTDHQYLASEVEKMVAYLRQSQGVATNPQTPSPASMAQSVVMQAITNHTS